jgi:hypothetical protein
MLLRVLVLIFAFNALIPSALAMGVKGNCMEMADTDSAMIMPHGDSGMTCNMSDMDKGCSEALCANGCLTSTTSVVPYDSAINIPSVSTAQPLFEVAYFYQIYPSINTPPPLV